MKVVTVIVTYKTKKSLLSQAVSTLKKLGSGKIIIIDNTKHNRGFAKAVNLGFKRVVLKNFDLLCVANPDIMVYKGSKTDLSHAMHYFDIFGGIMKQDGKNYLGGYIDKNNLAAGLKEGVLKKDFFSVDFVSGSLMFIKPEVYLSLGGFDERFFMYYEDVDFCYRAIKNSFKVGVTKAIVYKHFETSKNLKNKKSLLLESWLKFVLKNGNLKQKIRALSKIIPQKVLNKLWKLV